MKKNLTSGRVKVTSTINLPREVAHIQKALRLAAKVKAGKIRTRPATDFLKEIEKQ